MANRLKIISCSLLCALQLHATSLDSQTLRSSLSKPQFEQTLSTLSADTSDQDEFWYWLNLARLQQANGEFNNSINSFQKSFEILDEYENRAKVSLRNVGSFLGSSFLSKGAETYYGKGYERTLMHTLNALNYAMLSNFEGASVEMRRMEQRQEFWLSETEEKIKEAAEEQAKAEKEGNNVSSIPSEYSMSAMLEDESVRRLANSYQDPFSYALSSIITNIAFPSENLGEVSLKRALTLNPDVSKAFVKLPTSALPTVSAKVKPIAKGKKGAPALNNQPTTPKIEKMEITVVVLAGEAPSVKIEKIHFPLFNGANYTSIDLPSYNPPINDVSVVTISTDKLRLQPPRLLQTNAMAYKTLKDELIGELSKSVVRATSKAVIAKQASDNFGFLGGFVASLAMDAGSSAADSGYRNWELLPNSGYLSKFEALQGETFTITMNDRQESFTLPKDKKGVLVLVSYITNDNIRIDHVAY
ncbi:hypothetical protein [Sulfuricurvum sp.]|uniref:COG3014 family protein n=1 Tax=Sulfuricurvum sp. TaxID=2025608 RepID=UPI002E34F1B7|nr:hypothetical protein [Sulfuricurvum sp.]HEX5329910.1 hypothetical protein [Sulfuricurvum sp.]